MIRVFSQYISTKSLALVALECIITALALMLGVKLRFWSSPDEFQSYTNVPTFAAQTAICVLVLQICLYYSDFYDLRTIKRRHEQMICLAQSIGAACVVLAVVYYVFPVLLIGRGVFLTSMAVVATAIMASRLVLDTAWRMAAAGHNILVLGTGDLGLTVVKELSSRDDLNVCLSGLVPLSNEARSPGELLGEHAVLGSTEELEQIVKRHRISKIVVAFDHAQDLLPVGALVRLRVQGIRVEDAHTTISALTGRVWLEAVQSNWFLFSAGFHRSKWTMASKRAFDLLFCIAGLIVSVPIMILIAIVIRLDSRGGVIYRQTRVGYKGRHFELLKFRSMRVDAESGTGAQWAQERDPRTTRVGKFLRKYRFDELPQFINVIRGDMSFVGPRPERPVFVERLRNDIPYYDERHMVRPGLTGWAQVQYHYGSTTEHALRKLEYDLFYQMNMSVLFDCAIAVKTVRILLSGSGSR
jgi:sugar transferase (PEP-CTERM system associated)